MNELSKTRVEGAREDIRPDWVPADRWVGEDNARLERERLWPRIWHIACREEEIPRVGDYITYEILDESIILVRSDEDTISAYYNVCQHRGRRLVNPGKGFSKGGFLCNYHGWKWDMEGNNTFVFHEEQWAGCPAFTREEVALKRPQVDRFGGWVWVNMDPDAVSLREWLEPVGEWLEPFEFDKLRRAWFETVIAPVNWKVVMEAFHEGYHSGATHNSWVDYYSMLSPTHAYGKHCGFTTQFLEMPRMKREDGKWTPAVSGADMLYYQSKELHDELSAQVSDSGMRALERLRAEFPPGSDEANLFPRFIELQKEEMAADGVAWPEKLDMEAMLKPGISIHIFPNTIVLPTVDAVLWYRMRPHPDDAEKCIFDIWSLNRYAPGKEPEVTQHVSEGFAAAKGRNPFLEQDFGNMEAVQKGMRSRGWQGARTNPLEEVTVNHFHKMLDEYYAMAPLA